MLCGVRGGFYLFIYNKPMETRSFMVTSPVMRLVFGEVTGHSLMAYFCIKASASRAYAFEGMVLGLVVMTR